MEIIKKQPFHLLRYFLIVSIVSIPVASYVLGKVFRENAIGNLVSLGEDKNINIARVVANHVWPKYSKQFELLGNMQAEQMRKQLFMSVLQKKVEQYIKQTSVIKLKIYNPEGKTLFSTASDQIGIIKKQSKPLDDAIKGQTVTKLAFRDKIYAMDELLTQRNILSTYLPISDTNSVIGVIEVYSDVTTLYEKITSEHNAIVTGVIFVLLGLYAIIFIFVYRADKTIRLQCVEKQHDEEKIKYIAYHDSLTGLANRDLYRYKVEGAIEQAKRNESLAAILFIDLDRFKQINDSLGHNVGDELLKQVASRLLECVRTSDTVARQGGDEFTILLEGVKHVDEIVQVCKRINASIRQTYKIDGNELFSSASIGVTVYPFDDLKVDHLLKDADTAMYEAKESGRDKYIFFSTGMKRANVDQIILEQKLRKALEENEYIINYQPIIDLRTGDMTGVEALLRWDSQDYGVVSPVKFIPLLEETGVMAIVGEWVMKAVCEKAKQWQDEGYDPVTVAINISIVQFRKMNFVKTVEEALVQSELEPQYLKLELTESLLMDQSDTCVKKLLAVRALGVSIEADDFGTGYSSLSYLKRLPIDILKIDRSFITDVHKSSDSAAIVTAIMAMAYSLKLDVIAEGVEQIEELRFLSALNCNLIQGYLFSKPLSESDLKNVMSDPDYFRNKLLEINENNTAIAS
ncbi:MAG: EAL domain-containing protein [Gammaproteobacteria bacterium]|nr:EAL domain-containing protein [Gammaproteobacteria bacterium]